MPELPKLSQFTNMLATPEQMFESTVKNTTGQEIPKGPQSRLADIQESVEAGEGGLPTPGPEGPLGGLPKMEMPSLPDIESMVGGAPGLGEAFGGAPSAGAGTVEEEVGGATEEEEVPEMMSAPEPEIGREGKGLLL